MPSKAALAAARDIACDVMCGGQMERRAFEDKFAAIIDDHFAPYLATVEALRKLEDEIYPFDTDDTWGYMIGDDSALQNARAALAAIDAQTPPDSERI